MSSGAVTCRQVLEAKVTQVFPCSSVPPSPHSTTQTPIEVPVGAAEPDREAQLCPGEVLTGTSCHSDALPPPPTEPVLVSRKYWPSCAVPLWYAAQFAPGVRFQPDALPPSKLAYCSPLLTSCGSVEVVVGPGGLQVDLGAQRCCGQMARVSRRHG